MGECTCVCVEVAQCYKHQWSLFTCSVSLWEAVVYQDIHTDIKCVYSKDERVCVDMFVCMFVCDYYPIIVYF